MLVAAARRFLIIVGGTVGAVALFSLVVGALLGASANRSISVGLYASGSVAMLVGFFFGLRGPMRPVEHGPSLFSIPIFGGTPARRASPDEQRQTVSTSALYVVVGMILLVVAVAVDSRYRLV